MNLVVTAKKIGIPHFVHRGKISQLMSQKERNSGVKVVVNAGNCCALFKHVMLFVGFYNAHL